MCPSLAALCLGLLYLSRIHCSADHPGTLTVSVHYQTSDWESIRFITRQLFPLFLELNHQETVGQPLKMSVKLVPFEMAQNVDTLVANCNDPNNRCLANKIHACAVTKFNNDWHSLNFINCLLITGYANVKDCAKLTCTNHQQVALAACVNSVDGDHLLIANGARARSIAVAKTTWQPLITFNDVFEAENQLPATVNLIALLCKKFPMNVEGFCGGPRTNSTMLHANYGTDYFLPLNWRCVY